MERLKEVKIIEARLRVHEEDMNSNHKSKSVLSEDADSYFLSYAQENGRKSPVCNEEKSNCPSIPAQKNEKRDTPNSELSEKIKQDNSVPRCHCNDQENVATIVPARRQRTVPARLPVPEPTVFSGDILKFIEWKASFEMIIDHYCSRPIDKLFYLQKYVGGEAKKVLEGNFYRTDEEAYKQAWEKLNARYGHPFLVQRAFREKLNNCPKIGPKEHFKLQEYGDFLQACSNAIPHVRRLEVLNDYLENHRMLTKLPEEVASRWNRYVTEQLDLSKNLTSFEKFSEFVNKEARIACNPVTASYALKSLEERPERDIRHARATSFTTNTTAKGTYDSKFKVTTGISRETEPTNPQTTFKCIFCGESHSIHKCQQLKEKSPNEKKKFVLDNQLCFGCLRKGHITKECKKGPHAACAKDAILHHYMKNIQRRINPQYLKMLRKKRKHRYSLAE
ncbi:uncharacterized protein [Aquarana catesbeiana]|uniref:uncharacterized protein n=1 Tax=Aquarana catesbeiana TaxID=8400 RepID=UPI003CCA01FE